MTSSWNVVPFGWFGTNVLGKNFASINFTQLLSWRWRQEVYLKHW